MHSQLRTVFLTKEFKAPGTYIRLSLYLIGAIVVSRCRTNYLDKSAVKQHFYLDKSVVSIG